MFIQPSILECHQYFRNRPRECGKARPSKTPTLPPTPRVRMATRRISSLLPPLAQLLTGSVSTRGAAGPRPDRGSGARPGRRNSRRFGRCGNNRRCARKKSTAGGIVEPQPAGQGPPGCRAARADCPYTNRPDRRPPRPGARPAPGSGRRACKNPPPLPGAPCPRGAGTARQNAPPLLEKSRRQPSPSRSSGPTWAGTSRDKATWPSWAALNGQAYRQPSLASTPMERSGQARRKAVTMAASLAVSRLRERSSTSRLDGLNRVAAAYSRRLTARAALSGRELTLGTATRARATSGAASDRAMSK